ncbi:MAG: alpha/beta hydrolase [Luteolibacter sp.]|uniref:alpha/beta hydrolase n=1 Tax=Luteolibacter sp. TaxID=1962973 RepID=UPI00326751FF
MRRIVRLMGLLLASSAMLGAEEVMKDIEYGNAGGESLCLDARVPPGEGPFPIAIIIHGGGWGSGDKTQDIDALFEPLTKAGFAWFSINYRLAPKHPWPACFDDTRMAIGWVKAHARQYKGDPQRIALIGYSAGGQLALLAAIRADDSTRVQAVVGVAPAADLVADSRRRGVVSKSLQNLLILPEKLDEAAFAKIAAISPAEEVKPGLPPFLLLQGTADQSVRHEDTLAFAGKLQKAKVPCEFVSLEGAPHRISDWPKFSPDYPAKIVVWLTKVLGNG